MAISFHTEKLQPKCFTVLQNANVRTAWVTMIRQTRREGGPRDERQREEKDLSRLPGFFSVILPITCQEETDLEGALARGRNSPTVNLLTNSGFN